MPFFRSPNGQGLADWPKYGAGEEYLEIKENEQAVRRELRRKRFITVTQTIPKKIQEQNQKKHSEL